MRILIADDEQLVRFGLKSMLEEMGLPGRQVDAARDGRELVEAVRRAAPDVAFVDIRMPRLDGLAAIEEARALSPSTRWVILTSHSSFDFARRAIQLGVTEYLLKPVAPGELARVIARVREEIGRELRARNEEFEGRIGSVLHGTLAAEAVGLPGTSRFLGALLVLDSALPEAGLAARQREVCRVLRAQAAAGLERRTRAGVCTLPEGHLALICAWTPVSGDAGTAESMRAFLSRAASSAATAAGPGVRVTLILTVECAGLEELTAQLARAGDLVPLRVAQGLGGLRDIEDLERRRGEPGWSGLCGALEGMARAARERSRLDFLSGIDEVQRCLGGMDPAVRPRAERCAADFLELVLGVRPPADAADPGWRGGLMDCCDALRPEEGASARELSDQVVDYARANYMRDIGIGQIALHLGVTPNYLSSLFHRGKGTTFVRWITRLRMEKARELLSAPGARVQDVARAVGYESVRHFSRLFQKQHGSYPSEVPRVEKNAPGS